MIAEYTFISDSDRVRMMMDREHSYRVGNNTLWIHIQRHKWNRAKFWIGHTFGCPRYDISADGIARRLKKRYWHRYIVHPDKYTHKQYKNQVALAPLWEEIYQRWSSV